MKIKNRDRFRCFVSLVLAIALLCNAVSANAASKYIGVDDDDAQGNSNSSIGTWTKVRSDNLKYGEGLITPCTLTSGGGQKEYQWLFNRIGGYGKVGVTFSVWLYHSSFNDPAARYYAKVSNLYSVLCGQVNQDTAPAGWTDFPKTEWASFYPNNSNGVSGFCLDPSTRGSSYTCGADWVEATVYYTN